MPCHTLTGCIDWRNRGVMQVACPHSSLTDSMYRLAKSRGDAGVAVTGDIDTTMYRLAKSRGDAGSSVMPMQSVSMYRLAKSRGQYGRKAGSPERQGSGPWPSTATLLRAMRTRSTKRL